MKIAASCFSIYAYVALKKELESIDSLEFIFASPTFVPNEVSDKMKKEQREFHIPKAERERSLGGGAREVRCLRWVGCRSRRATRRQFAPAVACAGMKHTLPHTRAP